MVLVSFATIGRANVNLHESLTQTVCRCHFICVHKSQKEANMWARNGRHSGCAAMGTNTEFMSLVQRVQQNYAHAGLMISYEINLIIQTSSRLHSQTQNVFFIVSIFTVPNLDTAKMYATALGDCRLRSKRISMEIKKTLRRKRMYIGRCTELCYMKVILFG